MRLFFISFIIVLNLFVWFVFPWVIKRQMRLDPGKWFKRVLRIVQVVFGLVSIYGIYKVLLMFES